jgi:hypothetical protein
MTMHGSGHAGARCRARCLVGATALTATSGVASRVDVWISPEAESAPALLEAYRAWMSPD